METKLTNFTYPNRENGVSELTSLLYFWAMKQITSCLLLLSLIILGSGCSEEKKKAKKEAEEKLTELSSESNQISFKDSIYRFNVEINYPVFKADDPKAEKMLNDIVQNQIREYRGFEVEYRDNFEELLEALGSSRHIGENDLIVNFRVIDSCERIISMIFEVGTFYLGSAQSTFFQDCFNFDLQDMSPIYDSHIFGSTEDVLIPLTSMVNEKVRNMQENQCEGLSGPEELYHFINNFNLSPKGITFHFSDFSICPFAGTNPNISFSWEEVRSLSRSGLLERYCETNS